MNQSIQKNAQTGSSMIEVLISMLILLVGILGVAGLQTRGLGDSKGSYYRTQAAIFAEDLFDRMRVNRTGSTTSKYDVPDSSGLGDATSPACDGASCEAEQLANYDLANWAFRVKSVLPRASFTITRADDNTTILLRWDDSRTGSAGTNCGVDVTCLEFTSRM